MDEASKSLLGFDAAVLHDYEGDGLQGERTREMATAEWSILDGASWDGSELTFFASRGVARATIDGNMMSGTQSPEAHEGPEAAATAGVGHPRRYAAAVLAARPERTRSTSPASEPLLPRSVARSVGASAGGNRPAW